MMIFISYSSRNRELAETLVLWLGEMGHDVLYESKIIGGPVSWRHVFEGIKACDVFIAAETPESLVSESCIIEYRYALALNKHILSVLMKSKNDKLLSANPAMLDCRPENPNALKRLVNALEDLPDTHPIPDPVPLPPDWISPLAELRKQIEYLDNRFVKQAAITLNLREFLEHRETFEVAASLLDILNQQKNIHPKVAHEIKKINHEIKRTRHLTKAALRHRLMLGAVSLSVSVAFGVLLLTNQVAIPFLSSTSPTADEAHAESKTIKMNIAKVDEIVADDAATLDTVDFRPYHQYFSATDDNAWTR